MGFAVDASFSHFKLRYAWCHILYFVVKRETMYIRANFYRCISAILAAFLVTACAQDELPKDAATANNDVTATAEDVIKMAVAHDGRTDNDIADDPSRKPIDVLTFVGVKPGIHIFEVEAGRGYYTELFSHIVGEDGKVYMQNPAGFDAFLGDAVAMRLADNRLPNVISTKSSFDNLQADDESVDLVTWFLGPHELFFTPADGVPLGEVEQSYAEIFRILKPGGQFVVLDHAAMPGSSVDTGQTLHRIDPIIVRRLAEGAGFELIDESDVLRNSDDDYSVHVFDASVRRKTDRFLMKFRKLP